MDDNRIITLSVNGVYIDHLTMAEFMKMSTDRILKLGELKKAEGRLPRSEQITLDRFLDLQHILQFKVK